MSCRESHVFSDTESENETNSTRNNKENNSSELYFVAKFVKSHPIILNKSKTPSATERKEKALNDLKKNYAQHFGKTTDVKKLLKQINNLKANVKKKTDATVTGNKSKKLSASEQILYEVMQGDTEETNPVFHKVRGSVAVGVKETNPLPECSTLEQRPPPPPKRAKCDKYETAETKHLTTSELQRLVLLEQLQLIRLQKEKLEKEMERERHQTLEQVGDLEYTML